MGMLVWMWAYLFSKWRWALGCRCVKSVLRFVLVCARERDE